MARAAKPKTVIYYHDEKGNKLFRVWLESVKDMKHRLAIIDRLVRLGQGNYGDCESVGKGVSELRIHKGPGFRVYFAEPKTDVALVLCGGTKRTQKKDIKAAQFYLETYKADE